MTRFSNASYSDITKASPPPQLLSQSLRLPSPVVRIRIEYEHVAIRECYVEDVTEGEEDDERNPLQPSRASRALVERREGDEGEEKDQGEFDSLTNGAHIFQSVG